MMISISQTSVREKKRRILFKSLEKQKILQKFVQINARNLGYVYINKLPKSQIRNLCLITGHAHSIYTKHFRMSRHQIKKYFSFIKGVRNSTW